MPHPLRAAAIGAALAAAVSNAGGLGGLGMWGFSAEDAERRIAGFRQQSGGSLNVNYPIWPEPRITAGASEAMRKRLQPYYDAKGLGAAPQPEGAASEVSREHLAMLLRARPQVVSFHFGLPGRESIEAIRSAGIFVICSATTVAEARILEQSGVDAIIARIGEHHGDVVGEEIGARDLPGAAVAQNREEPLARGHENAVAHCHPPDKDCRT